MVKRVVLAALGLLLMAGALLAELKVEGDSKIKEHGLGVLTAAGVGETAQFRWATPSGLSVRKEKGTLVYTGAPGEYKVDLLVIDFDKKTFEEKTVTVVIEPKTPPPPVKDPVPIPNKPAPSPKQAIGKQTFGRSG